MFLVLDLRLKLHLVDSGVVFEDVERLVYALRQAEVLVVYLELVVVHLSQVHEIVNQVLHHLLRVGLDLDYLQGAVNLSAQALVKVLAIVHLCQGLLS